MSATGVNTEKSAKAARPGLLRYEVYVTPGLPIVARDKPPGV